MNQFSYPLLIVILLLTSIFTNAQEQTQILKYEIIMGSSPIGEITAVRTEKDGRVYCKNSSIAAMRIITMQKLTYDFETTYKDGIIESASTLNQLNNNTRTYSNMKWVGDKYEVDVDGKKYDITEPVDYSAVSLYWEEPIGLTQVFSERFGKYLPLKQIKPHFYELTLPDGKITHYTYEDGICTKVEINHWFRNFYYVLKQ